MFKRARMTFVIIVIMVTVFVIESPRTDLAAASENAVGPIAVEVANLKDQLEKGLKARLPSEFAFIGTVITMVDSDQLSSVLVLETFHWARKKTKYKKYVFPYFERGLRERALKLGVTIP